MQPHSGMGQSDCIQQCTDQLNFVHVLVIAGVMMMMVVVITCLLNFYRHSGRSLTLREEQARQGPIPHNSHSHRTTTDQVLFGWWIILSTPVTLMWWCCVSVCCAGLSGSDTAVPLEFLNTSMSHRPENSPPTKIVQPLPSYRQHPVIAAEGLEDDYQTVQKQQIHTSRPPDQCPSYLQRDTLGQFQPTYPYLIQSIIDLPPSIALPDGEEPPPYHGACSLQLRDHEQQLELNRESVRPPPNRTIFDSHLIDTVLCPPSMKAGISAATNKYTLPAYSDIIRHYCHPSSLTQYIQTPAGIESPPLIYGNVGSDSPQISSTQSQKTDKDKQKAQYI